MAAAHVKRPQLCCVRVNGRARHEEGEIKKGWKQQLTMEEWTQREGGEEEAEKEEEEDDDEAGEKKKKSEWEMPLTRLLRHTVTYPRKMHQNP